MNESLLTGNQTQEIDPNKNYLDELVGDQKKFKTPEDLAKGKYIADNYIKTLEQQLDEMRTDYQKLDVDYKARAKLEEYIDQLQSQQRLDNNRDRTPDPDNEDKAPKFDPNQLDSLVSNKFKEYELNREYQKNYNDVKNKLIERFGSDYQNKVKTQIDSLGITEDFFNDLARKHPSVLYKTLGLDQQQKDGYTPPPRSNQRSDTFAPTVQKRTWSYYQKMKLEKPDLYRDPKTHVQMHHDALELGDAFNDGDFNR